MAQRYHSPIPIIKRHWETSWPYLDARKIFNIILSKIEEKLGRTKISAQPYFIKLEPTNRCNLKCVGCIHAADRTELEDSHYFGEMDLAVLNKIVKELGKYLVKVSLYAVGEPLIYKNIAETVKILSDHQIGSVISSNMNYMTPELAHDLVKNQLTHLIVSLDGCDPETYSQYRKGGDFNKVIENVKTIQAEKKAQKSKYPILEIQTIKFSYLGEEELQKVRELAKSLGAERFGIKEDAMPYFDGKVKPEPMTCFWLYGNPMFHWNGVVQPCCYFYEFENNNFGDISKQSFKDIWNNEKYQSARKYFATGEKGNLDLKCYNCIFFTPKGKDVKAVKAVKDINDGTK